MIEIPAGKFIMGLTVEQATSLFVAYKADFPSSPLGPNLDDLPQLSVYLNTFRIDQVEVNNDHYSRCVKAGICRAVPSVDKLPPTYPVVSVTWDDANVYCRWVDKRLPTEAEWEKAARGEDGRLYPWGNRWDNSRANAKVTNWNDLRPVGGLRQGASPYGVLDMGDNAYEWTSDWYDLYPSNPYLPAVNEEAKHDKVYRGGANPHTAVTHRLYSPPGMTYDLLGFRCARGPEPAQTLASVVLSTSVQPMISPITIPVDTSKMVFVPAGEFIMGTGSQVDRDNPYTGSPAHIVYLDSFFIDRYEVRVAEYVKFLNALGSNHLRCYGYSCVQEYEDKLAVQWIETINNHYQAQSGFEDRPVVGVSWQGAQAYCHWVGKRLPTEAQWEKAARGTDGRLYPWGNDWDPNRAATPGQIFEGGVYPFSIGTFPGDISPYGTYDMLGNATEWVADWFSSSYYAASPYANPQGPESGDERVLRGLYGRPEKIGVFYREFGDYGLFIGFRCAF